MRPLTERMNLAKTLLHELSRQPLRRTELEMRTVQKMGSTHGTFDGILRYLVQGGFVQKADQKHFANYLITAKGKKLLEAIQ